MTKIQLFGSIFGILFLVYSGWFLHGMYNDHVNYKLNQAISDVVTQFNETQQKNVTEMISYIDKNYKENQKIITVEIPKIVEKQPIIYSNICLDQEGYDFLEQYKQQSIKDIKGIK